MQQCPECGALLKIGYVNGNSGDEFCYCDSCGWNEVDDAPSLQGDSQCAPPVLSPAWQLAALSRLDNLSGCCCQLHPA